MSRDTFSIVCFVVPPTETMKFEIMLKFSSPPCCVVLCQVSSALLLCQFVATPSEQWPWPSGVTVHSTMMNVTWPRCDQSTEHVVDGHVAIYRWRMTVTVTLHTWIMIVISRQLMKRKCNIKTHVRRQHTYHVHHSTLISTRTASALIAETADMSLQQ